MKKLLFDKNDHSIKLILAKNISMNFNKEIKKTPQYQSIKGPFHNKRINQFLLSLVFCPALSEFKYLTLL